MYVTIITLIRSCDFLNFGNPATSLSLWQIIMTSNFACYPGNHIKTFCNKLDHKHLATSHRNYESMATVKSNHAC